MGCGNSVNDAIKEVKKRQTVFGVLEVKILEAHIEHETSTVSKMDPYVNIKFSNQKFSGQVVKKGGKDPKFKDIFRFIVNSYYKFYGRCLQVELMDSNIGSDSNIGYGIIDLDPYLNALQSKPSQPNSELGKSKPQSTLLRCFLNYERQQAAIIMLQATFIPQKTDVINLRFETAEFKRSTRTFGDMQCYVRVSIGEEVLVTKKSKDTKSEMPVWKTEQHLSFTVPISCDTVLIQVMDEEELIGSVSMQKLDFMKEDESLQFRKEIKYKGQGAGELRFISKLKSIPEFKQLNAEYKKKGDQPQKKKDDKKDEKKEEKKEDKKQEPKEGEKKQQKKEQKKEQPKEKPKEEKKQDK